jgi:hypothetical protein
LPATQSQASASPRLLLWPAATDGAPSAGAWHEAVRRGQAVGWIRLRGTTESALAALGGFALPQLRIDDVRAALTGPAEAGQVQRLGELRIVTAHLPTLRMSAGGELRLELRAIRIIATRKWVISYAESFTDRQDAIDELLDGVDLEASTGSNPTGCDLGLRILLAVAEACDTVSSNAARELDKAKSTSQLEGLQAVLGQVERSLSTLRRRGRQTHSAWFPAHAEGQSAEGIAQILDDATGRVRVAKDEAMRREARLRADAERRSADALQFFLGTVAAVLLGPALVAGIFDAFPGWQPVKRRDDTFIGLALASGGAIWLLVYAIPALMARRHRKPLMSVAAIAVGVVPLGIGLIVALPLQAGLDDSPPEIAVRCCRRRVKTRPPAPVEN